jgi:hypothetical protein
MSTVVQAFLALFLTGISCVARSEEPDLSRLTCPVRTSADVQLRYEHKHEVPVVGSDQPIEVVSDELTVVGRDSKIVCFGLITYARNFHMCGLMGAAHLGDDGSFLFQEGEVTIRLIILSDRKIQVSAVGDGYRTRCGMYGVIENATYELSMQANKSLKRTRGL